MWDLYDENLKITKNTVHGEEEIPDGFYHISVEIWIVNKLKQVMLLKNSIDYTKRYPGCWSCIGGNLQSKETIDDAINRIIDEKIGINLFIKDRVINNPIKRESCKYAYITCILYSDINLNDISFKDKSAIDARFVSEDELIKMCKNGEIAYYLINRINNEIIKLID